MRVKMGGYALMVIGLTGKSASGKDAVARILSKLGFVIVDEDALGHDALIEKKDKIAAEFGPSVLKDGEIDRKELSRIVFSDVSNLERLEAISHPFMVNRTKEIIEEAKKEEKSVVINAAILNRLHLDEISDQVIYVHSPYQMRLERAMRRDNISAEAFERRSSAQSDITPYNIKKGVPVVMIMNLSDEKELYRQVHVYYDNIKSRGLI